MRLYSCIVNSDCGSEVSEDLKKIKEIVNEDFNSRNKANT